MARSSLSLKRPAKLARVELVGLPMEAKLPLLPPKQNVFQIEIYAYFEVLKKRNFRDVFGQFFEYFQMNQNKNFFCGSHILKSLYLNYYKYKYVIAKIL